MYFREDLKVATFRRYISKISYLIANETSIQLLFFVFFWNSWCWYLIWKLALVFNFSFYFLSVLYTDSLGSFISYLLFLMIVCSFSLWLDFFCHQVLNEHCSLQSKFFLVLLSLLWHSYYHNCKRPSRIYVSECIFENAISNSYVVVVFWWGLLLAVALILLLSFLLQAIFLFVFFLGPHLLQEVVKTFGEFLVSVVSNSLEHNSFSLFLL